jgi:hypothetical protein
LSTANFASSAKFGRAKAPLGTPYESQPEDLLAAARLKSRFML